MYDGSSDPYDHMLHFNQAMILNAGNDRLLCKVFPASLKGLALAWFHKLPRRSINSFSDLWAAFVSQYLCSVRQKGNISSLQTIFKREDESIRDFTKRFGRVVQQIYSYSMDAVLQNFRRSFGPTTTFFHLLSLDPPAAMEKLYRRVDKYSMLKDNIQAASQTVMITTQSSKPSTKGQYEQKGSQSKNQKRFRDQSEKKKEPSQFTPLNISNDKLLPLIQDHPDFKWPKPIQSDPAQRNQSLRCDYHRDHGHETNRCQSLKFLVERLIRAGHLRKYVLETVNGVEATLAVERIMASVELLPEPRPTINYILGGPVDDQYQSKRQKRRLLRVATARALVNTIHVPDSSRAIQPIDGPIFFPPVNPSRVITPHHDALVLTLCINDFDVHRVLVDPSSATDLLQLPAFRQMNISFDRLSLIGRILSGFNGATTITMVDNALPSRQGR